MGHDDEKEEILLDSLGSGGASGVSVEAYPRLNTQDYQNVALLVVLCKYDFEIITNKLHCMCMYLFIDQIILLYSYRFITGDSRGPGIWLNSISLKSKIILFTNWTLFFSFLSR